MSVRKDNPARLYALLAASYPEPIDGADLSRRTGMPRRVCEVALRQCLATQIVRRVRRLRAKDGYAYTVNA
jgi:hypothetical protein